VNANIWCELTVRVECGAEGKGGLGLFELKSALQGRLPGGGGGTESADGDKFSRGNTNVGKTNVGEGWNVEKRGEEEGFELA